MTAFEKRILDEARSATGRPRLRWSDITQYATFRVDPEQGEARVFLPRSGVHCTIKLPGSKRR